jgi:hypothetical protein
MWILALPKYTDEPRICRQRSLNGARARIGQKVGVNRIIFENEINIKLV